MPKYDTIKIDIADWQEKLDELLLDEDVSFETWQDVVETMQKHKIQISLMAEIMLAAKNRNLIKDDNIWPGHKELLKGIGGKGQLRMRLAAERDLCRELQNGVEVKQRNWIGVVRMPQAVHTDVKHAVETVNGNDDVYVSTESDTGIQRARYYIMYKIIGHIRNHFVILADHEDLRILADDLIAEINEIVEELT